MLTLICALLLLAFAVGEGAASDGAPSPSAPAVGPDSFDDFDEPFLDDGGLVDIGPPGTVLPPHWRVDLSVPAIRERAETAPGRGPWSVCIDPATVADLAWDRACARLGGGRSEPDVSGRRGVLFAAVGCTGPSIGLPGADPSPDRVPPELNGGLILRCVPQAPEP